MKHTLQVLKFEYLSCVKSKSFIISTIIFMVLILGMTFIPAIISSIQSAESGKEADTLPVIAVSNKAYDEDQEVKTILEKYYPDYEVRLVKDETEELKKKVDSTEYSFALVLDAPTDYTYITKNNSVMDRNNAQVNAAATELFRTAGLRSLGVPAEKATELLNTRLNANTVITGVDQTKNYFSTYIIIMLLYMAVIMYGQMVSQSVVSEKNTRAMEMLITCARPSHLMFGKVLGSGLAGLTQLGLIIATAITSVSTIGAKSIPPEVLDFVHIPISFGLYALLFFLLGYFIYSFLLAAFSSLASRSEDLNTLITPVMILYIAAFLIVVMCMNSDHINSPLMIVCSYIPFSAPIAMFARIALSDVSVLEITISVLVQLAAIYLLGMLSAAIYRVGVLLYGKPPKPAEIINLLKEQHKQKKAALKE